MRGQLDAATKGKLIPEQPERVKRCPSCGLLLGEETRACPRCLHKGAVLQEPFLFSGSIAENIAYGKPDAASEEIIAAAKIANAHDFIVSKPDGYDKQVGEQGGHLSAGEK